jgi:hypothetical protein
MSIRVELLSTHPVRAIAPHTPMKRSSFTPQS